MRPLLTNCRLDPPLAYDGSQLRPHFIRQTFGLKGDAAVAFRGGCHVEGPALVDLEDQAAGAFIHSADMLHLLVELFATDLTRAVLLQRLLAALVADRLRASLPPAEAARVVRHGDDVFVGNRKLSVSIATLSPVSALIHFGINIDDRDTPVPAVGLQRLGLQVESFARGILGDLVVEIEGLAAALCKVRPVGGEPGHS